MFVSWQLLCTWVCAAGRGRGRGRGRLLAAADDIPVVGLDASAMANSPGESASVEPQPQRRGGRGKAASQGAPRTVGRELGVLPDSQKLDARSSAAPSPLADQKTDVGGRRVVEASSDNIVISFSNTDTDAVVAPAASIVQKPPKIGSGRLGGKTEAVGGRKLRGKRGKGHLAARTASVEEPVTIGVAVIRTPSDRPNVEYHAVDEKTPKLKGILKRTQLERRDDWVEEPVETVDWDRELEEAQRRKDKLSSNGLEGSTATIETGVKETDAVKSSSDVSNVDADDDDEWEDVEDDEVLDEDLHDISAESFDKFIQEHTLKLDVALATPDVTEWTTKDPSGSITTGSQDSFLKTPVGQSRVVDWGAEMDQLSQTEKQRRVSVELGECTLLLL